MYNYKILKKWRKKCGFRQKDICLAIGLKSTDNISRYEDGTTDIPASRLSMLIKFYAGYLTPSNFNLFISELLGLNIKVLTKNQPDDKYIKLLEEYTFLLKKYAKLKDILHEHIKEGCSINATTLIL